MTETKEAEIKRAWANFTGQWPRSSSGAPMPFLCIAKSPPALVRRSPGPSVQPIPTRGHFEFKREEGYQDGRAAIRIVCEGVVVDMWPFPAQEPGR